MHPIESRLVSAQEEQRMVQDADTGNLVMVPIVHASFSQLGITGSQRNEYAPAGPSASDRYWQDTMPGRHPYHQPADPWNHDGHHPSAFHDSAHRRSPVVQGKDWIVTNLVASLQRATCKGIRMMTRWPKKLWAPLGDGDLTPLRDGAPLNLGNPCLSTRFVDVFPDALVGPISKSIDKVLCSGTRSTITSRIPSTSWT